MKIRRKKLLRQRWLVAQMEERLKELCVRLAVLAMIPHKGDNERQKIGCLPKRRVPSRSLVEIDFHLSLRDMRTQAGTEEEHRAVASRGGRHYHTMDRICKRECSDQISNTKDLVLVVHGHAPCVGVGNLHQDIAQPASVRQVVCCMAYRSGRTSAKRVK